jgi:glycosyltransferase involved in cell wall biosynthesis
MIDNCSSKVSVIIPVYNRRKTIIRAVQSVLAQSYSNIEVIIIDDGSTDGSIDLLKSNFSDDRLKYYSNDHNLGAAKSRNNGINVSSGDYIAFQDSDDEWYKDKLIKQIACLKTDNSDAVYCRYVRCDGEKRTIVPAMSHGIEMLTGEGLKSFLQSANAIGTPTLVINKNSMCSLGGFDESLSQMEDYDLAIRIAGRLKVSFVDEVLMNAYVTPNSVTYGRNEVDVYGKMNIKYPGYLSIMGKVYGLYNRGMINDDNGLLFGEISKLNLKRKDEEELFSYIQVQKHKNEMIINELFHFFLLKARKRSFAIYGTGKISQKATDFLQQIDLNPIFYIETKKTKDNFCNKNVVEVRDVIDTKIPVLIAAGVSNTVEIITKLAELDFTDITVFPINVKS